MALALGVSEELGWTASLHDSVMPEIGTPLAMVSIHVSSTPVEKM